MARGGKKKGVLTPESELVAEIVEQIPRGLEGTFYCKSRRRMITHFDCYEDHLDASAFNVRRSPCWRCPQGRQNREDYSRS